MELKRVGSQPSTKGPAEWFTGTVRIDPLFQASSPARVGGASVTFEPGARTAWHTHPLGQTLIVTAGLGWAQRWDGPVEEIRPGDVVWFPPGVKHWHGASTTAAMSGGEMPHVIVKMWPGKSERQKARLAEAIARDVMDALHYGEESVSVAIEEIPAAEWAEKVYRPDIVNISEGSLYKRPGYSM